MAKAKEKAEWGRLSNLMALIHNRTDFSERPRALQPIDFNRMAKRKGRVVAPKYDAKEAMSRFWDTNTKIPIRKMKLMPDGSWKEATDG